MSLQLVLWGVRFPEPQSTPGRLCGRLCITEALSVWPSTWPSVAGVYWALHFLPDSIASAGRRKGNAARLFFQTQEPAIPSTPGYVLGRETNKKPPAPLVALLREQCVRKGIGESVEKANL